MTTPDSIMLEIFPVCTDFAILAESPLAGRLFFYLLSVVTERRKVEIYRGEPIVLEPGEVLTSLKKISCDLNCGIGAARYALKLLRDESLVAVQASKRFSKVAITGYQLKESE